MDLKSLKWNINDTVKYMCVYIIDRNDFRPMNESIKNTANSNKQGHDSCTEWLNNPYTLGMCRCRIRGRHASPFRLADF